MPCLNEAETVATCVHKAVGFLAESGIDGEVLVADNGSTDGSQRLATDAGARVVPIAEKGYGNALMGGIAAAHGKYVIMGDADDSYDFTNLMPFVTELRTGKDLVMGNRFKGGIEPGAMPKLHRYLGNPVLSFIGRLFFPSAIGDFHCGLRGFSRESALRLNLQATGMEFASEMVVKATLWGQDIAEVPTTLKKDGRSRPPHLRSWRDGWRHLRFLLLFSPRWLFFLPGVVLFLLGLVAGASVEAGPVTIGGLTFDVDTLVAASAMVVIGFQSVLFWMFTRVYAGSEGFLPEEAGVQRLLGKLSLERGLLLGLLLGLAGLVGVIISVMSWDGGGFHNLNYEHELRLMVPSATALIVSCQLILSSFFLSILGIKQTRHSAFGREALAGGPPAGGPPAGGHPAGGHPADGALAGGTVNPSGEPAAAR
jgi:glycosyltransferase involved in cell wall biosynthesis